MPAVIERVRDDPNLARIDRVLIGATDAEALKGYKRRKAALGRADRLAEAINSLEARVAALEARGPKG